MGTLVKLVRVLMLGPVCVLMAAVAPRLPDGSMRSVRNRRLKISQLVPWFIVGFLALLGLRSAGLIPEIALEPASDVATLLTVVSMAALGLSVDIRSVAGAGGRVTAAVVLSLLSLGTISLFVIRLLAIA